MYDYFARLHRVVDGATLDLDVDLGFRVSARIRVRLVGIEARRDGEGREPSAAAVLFAQRWFEGRGKVEVHTFDDANKYDGRWLADVLPLRGFGETSSLSTMLLKAGHAEPYGGG